MCHLRLLLLVLVFTCGWPDRGRAQDEAAPDSTGRHLAPRVFLDCDRCDFSYIRREIPFANYVRDPESAQIHILITDQRTGSGGREYRLAFIGRGDFEGLDEELRYISAQADTRAEERSGLTRILQMGLLPYISQTPLSSQISISYEGGEISAASTAVDDPWNSWVFDIDFGGSYETESSRSELSYEGSASADRITEAWKFRNEIQIEYDRDTFENAFTEDGEVQTETITSASYERDFNSEVVRSITAHWSAGVFGNASMDPRRNTAFGTRLAPALEYSIFPYREADRREVTLAYSIGVRPVNYFEETIFGKTAETLTYESLRVRARFTQPWGSAFASLEGSHYFHDLSKYSVDFYGSVSVRLFKGLSLRLQMGAEAIHDQLFLERGDATLEEILLQRRQLATTYIFSSSFGLSYTFGSIYNNVVNTRF